MKPIDLNAIKELQKSNYKRPKIIRNFKDKKLRNKG